MPWSTAADDKKATISEVHATYELLIKDFYSFARSVYRIGPNVPHRGASAPFPARNNMLVNAHDTT